MELQKTKREQPEAYKGMIFIGNYCYDLLVVFSGILAALGESVHVIDASLTGELFHILSVYGGRTAQVVNFRQTDFIRCHEEKGLEALLDEYQRIGTKNRKTSILFCVYIDPVSFQKGQWNCFEKIKCRKIVLADACFHSMMPVLSMLQKEAFLADLFLFRALPGKKISFSYFLKIYKKEFLAFEKMIEIPWAEEDLEYRIRLDYEKSQGFRKLSAGYHDAVRELCRLAGDYEKSEMKRAFRCFEKKERERGILCR